MELNGILILTGIFFMMFGVAAAYLLGRWMDPIWRCRFLRKLTKKPYTVLNIRLQDGKTIETRVVNTEGDTIMLGNAIWAVQKGKVYLKYKPQTGLSVLSWLKEKLKKKEAKPKDMEKLLDQKLKEGENRSMGFMISKKYQQLEEGAPVVYVDYDSIKPLAFEGQETAVKPQEVGSALLALVMIHKQKALAAINQMGMLQKITVVLLAVCLILCAVNYMTLSEIRDTLMIGGTGAVSGAAATVQDGQMTITQPTGGKTT